MSSTVINTNVMSLTSQHNLRKSDNSLAQSLQRLSSGLRINSAKDDAAGLAISDRMTAMIRGNAQSIRNANDGISMVQTAEGALSTIGNDLQRMRELAVQSANDSNTALDRVTLDNEFQQLIRAIGRVANSTDFNTRKLLDGTLQSQFFQTGAMQGNTIAATSVDARNTQLGARQIIGSDGITEAQFKSGIQQINGKFTVEISEVRGQPVVPIKLEIDLMDPIFNPDVNAEGTPAGQTGLTTLEDVTRVVNNAIQRAIAGTESPGTFKFDAGAMSDSEARLKLAQANVSAAIVTQNDGKSTLIMRGAFDSQFQMQIDESIKASLDRGMSIGVSTLNASPTLTAAASVPPSTVAATTTLGGLNLTHTDPGDGVVVEFKLMDGTEVRSVVTGLPTTTTAGQLSFALAQNLQGASDISFHLSALNDGALTITDAQGRGIDTTSLTVSRITAVAAAPGTVTDSSSTIQLPPDFDANADLAVAGGLGVLQFDIAGQTQTIDLSSIAGGTVGDVNTAIEALIQAPGVFGPDTTITIAFTGVGNNVLEITDGQGRRIENVSLGWNASAADAAVVAAGATVDIPRDEIFSAGFDRTNFPAGYFGNLSFTFNGGGTTTIDLSTVSGSNLAAPGYVLETSAGQFQVRLTSSNDLVIENLTAGNVSITDINLQVNAAGVNALNPTEAFSAATTAAIEPGNYFKAAFELSNGDKLSLEVSGQDYANASELLGLLEMAAADAGYPELDFQLTTGLASGTALQIVDNQGRGIKPASIVITHATAANTQTPALTAQSRTTQIAEAEFPALFNAAALTGDEMVKLNFTLGGQDYQVDLAGVTDNATLQTRVNTALGAGNLGLTVAFNAGGDLLFTDAAGRRIENVSLALDGEVSTVSDPLLQGSFNANQQGEDVTELSLVIGGERIVVDVSQTQTLDELGAAVQTAITGYTNSQGATPFTNVVVSWDNATGTLTVNDPDQNPITELRLSSAPQAVTLFDSNLFDQALADPNIDNPYNSTQVNLTQINVTTRFDAMLALNIIDGALNQISDLRSELGAVQKLFESAVDNLGTYNVNLSAARSRILDTDFAAETAALTRAQILQQAGISTLSQANASPQAILSLLQ